MARRQTFFQSCRETGLVRFDALRQSVEVVERAHRQRLHGTYAERLGDGFGRTKILSSNARSGKVGRTLVAYAQISARVDSPSGSGSGTAGPPALKGLARRT
jgi:hypothetical protein